MIIRTREENKSNPRKYKVFDWFDVYEIIGYCDTMEEVNKLVNQYITDIISEGEPFDIYFIEFDEYNKDDKQSYHWYY